jgi:hypothetical protein
MKRLAVILMLAVSARGLAQEPEIHPAFELTVQTLNVIPVIFKRLEQIEVALKKLNPEQVQHLADELNRNALFEGRVLGRLTRHRAGPENYLWVQIRAIRETARTDQAKAEKMIQAVIDQFRKFGVEL